MNYQTTTLSNGLRVIHLQDASPVVYCGYGINAGSRDEAPGDEGLAHFCEHVTFKGTSRRRAWHVLNCLERVGGYLNAFTNKEDTFYHAAILREHLPRAVDLLTDIVLHSIYPQAEIDREAGKEIRLDGSEGYTFEANEGDTEDRFVVRFAGGELTGIQTIANGNSDNEKYYNLNGMQIEQPKKGLYLKNGKKVVVK